MTFRLMFLIAVALRFVASTGYAREPASVVLTYEIDGSVPGHAGDEGTKMVASAINERLGRRGTATVMDNKQIRVELYGKINQDRLKLLKRRIGVYGVLEFRILADAERANDLPIIKQAKLTPPNKRDVSIDNTKVAEWIPFDELNFGPAVREAGGIVKRQEGRVPEALVLIDDLNVTNEYFTSVKKGFDESKHVAIHFSLNKVGAEKLKQLTSDNLPEPSTPDAFRKLGMIFDKKLVYAPIIRTAISDRGIISGGSLSEQEVDSMIVVLNEGSLPCKIRLVEEKRVTEKK